MPTTLRTDRGGRKEGCRKRALWKITYNLYGGERHGVNWGELVRRSSRLANKGIPGPACRGQVMGDGETESAGVVQGSGTFN